MSPPPCNGTTFFHRCLLGAFLSIFLTKIKVLDGTLWYCVARSQRPTTTTSILRPIRPQLYVQFDLNYTSNSTSILHPIRPQLYIQFDVNFTSNSKPMGQLFFVDGTELGGHETPTRDSNCSSRLSLPMFSCEIILFIKIGTYIDRTKVL